MVLITGAQYEICAGDYQAVVTELGAGLRVLRYRGEPLISEYGADEVPGLAVHPPARNVGAWSAPYGTGAHPT